MQIIEAKEFIARQRSHGALLIDARSENEFAHACIPGAINIPLLNNEHRHQVGLTYKQKGREAAVELGFKLAGPLFHTFIQRATENTSKKDVQVYCWRGGMRSSIMSWILSMAGFNCILLKGGYKAFRNLVMSEFSFSRSLFVVGGHTGSGKTEVLGEIKKQGGQVIDLEALANHKGSAFGSLGQLPQPSNEQFENLLAVSLLSSDSEKPVWLEAESRSIGRIKIPDGFFEFFRSAPVFEIIRSREDRIRRILDEYGTFPLEALEECTMKLKKRLGGLRLAEAIQALRSGNFIQWVDILLEYYDKTYEHSLGERNSPVRIRNTFHGNESPMQIAHTLITLAGEHLEKKC